MSSVPIHARNHRPGGVDPIPFPGVFVKPIGIFGGGSQAPPDPDIFEYLAWTNTSFGIVEEGTVNGEYVTVSAAAYEGPTYSSNRATYPEIFCFIERPGIYVAVIDVKFFDTDAPPSGGEYTNFLEWSPGGLVSGGGGAGYAEYQAEYHDQAHAPDSYRGAIQYIHRETLLYVPPDTVPAPCNRYRAYSTYTSYDSLSVTGAVWKLADWDLKTAFS